MNLVQVLMAFVVAYLNGEYPIKGLDGVLSPQNRKDAIANIPELKSALAEYDAGSEIDWDYLAAGVKRFVTEYTKRSGAKASYIKYLNLFVSYYRTSSETALKTIIKMSSQVQDSFLRGFFKKEVVDQGSVANQLEKVVKRLGGPPGAIAFDLEGSKKAKEKNPELYAEYLGLRRQLTDAWKAEVSNFVRSSDHPLVKMSDLEKDLAKKGMMHTMPTGFVGLVDANANWYTMDGEQINGVPSAVQFPKVKMNPAYPDHSSYVFTAIDTNGGSGNNFYTINHAKAQLAEKQAKAKEFDVEAVRKKWLSILRGFNKENPTPQTTAALIIEILYRSSNRVGSKLLTNPKEGGFGISSLLVAHYYPQPNGDVKFIYLGKDSVKTITIIKANEDSVAKLVCQAVASLAEGKKPKDNLFTYNLRNGTFKPVNSGVVNKVFKSLSGGLTVHKLRTVKGNRLFKEYLDTLFAKRSKMDAKQTMEALMKGGALVGKELNHVRRSAEGTATVQPMTSLKNYIDAELQAELFVHYGIPIPAYLEKLMVSQDNEIASIVKASADDDGMDDIEVEDEPETKTDEDGNDVSEDPPGEPEDELYLLPSEDLLKQAMEEGLAELI